MLERMKFTQKEQDELLKSMVIVCDTREQKNDHITHYFDSKNIPWITKKLDACDYAFYLPKNEELGIPRDLWFDKECAIERKNSLEEISSCFTQSRDRLKKEFAAAPPNKIMVIENASYGDMVMGHYDTQYDPKSFWASYHSFWHEFNLPIMFIPDKKFTGLFIRGYFYYYVRGIIK